MALIQVNYLSKALFRTVTLNVVLPADKLDYATVEYVNPKGTKFKTLYLLHGLLGNYTDWISGTRIQRWAEERNLAVVMPSGDNSFYIKGKMPFDDYDEFIGNELPEVCRRMFPLSDKWEDTYIAGLSMGGYGAIRNGIVYSDTFSHVAGLSAAVHLFDKEVDREFEDDLFEDREKAAKTDMNPMVAYDELLASDRRKPRFYLCCGKCDDLYGTNVKLRDYLISKGADVTWDEDEKAAHDWDYWDMEIKKVLDWLPLESSDMGLGSGNVKLKEE